MSFFLILVVRRAGDKNIDCKVIRHISWSKGIQSERFDLEEYKKKKNKKIRERYEQDVEVAMI